MKRYAVTLTERELDSLERWLLWCEDPATVERPMSYAGRLPPDLPLPPVSPSPRRRSLAFGRLRSPTYIKR